MHTPLIIACRNEAEANQIREAAKVSGVPVYFEASNALTKLADVNDAILITTSLLQDDTAIDFITKTSIIAPTYTILWAKHAAAAQNLLKLYGSGCSAAIGPDESHLLETIVQIEDEVFEEIVIPPFFINDNDSPLKDPSGHTRLHVTVLGSQAMMTCANALLNLAASDALSLACVSNLSPWAMQQIIKNITDYTHWHAVTEPRIAPASVTLCQNLNMLQALEPSSNHVIICHGHLTDEEYAFVEALIPQARVFTATSEGYAGQISDDFEATLSPDRFWDHLISSLYD